MVSQRAASAEPFARWRRLARVLVGLASLAALVLWGFLQVASDHTPLGMLLAFGPRHWLTVLWIPLTAVSFLLGWPIALTATAGALVTLFGIAHFEVPSLSTFTRGSGTLRVLTYNTDGAARLPDRLRGELERKEIDVALFQDCTAQLSDSLNMLRPPAFHARRGYCVMSRWPLLAMDSLRVPDHGGMRAMHYTIRTPRGALQVYSVHLSSPRTALWNARLGDFGDLADAIATRRTESAALTQWVSRADGAIIVAGDFNLPDGSRILRDGWSDFTDAFEAAGLGFGHTMRGGRFTVRIDHALSRGVVTPIAVEVVGEVTSEHRPVLVTYAWPDSTR
jgi:endonuclease/exonuclease/phosphatase (EEP) superfamily protein YafD